MLATTLHLMRGTPYIYQGEEIGMTNPYFSDINDYRDVETLNFYQIMKDKGKDEKEIMEIIQSRSRDNARTPMQWDDSENAGFTIGNPWIKVADNYQSINVKNALTDENSVYYHYRKLISIRKKYDVVINGDFQLIFEDHPAIFAYLRNTESEKILVLSNFSEQNQSYSLPEHVLFDKYSFEVLISNYNSLPENLNNGTLRPFESIAYYIKKM